MRKRKPRHWLRVYCPQSGSRLALPTELVPIVLLEHEDLTIETSNEDLFGYAGRRRENPLYHFYQEGSFINCYTEKESVFGPTWTLDEQRVAFISPNGTRTETFRRCWWQIFHRTSDSGVEYLGGRVHLLDDWGQVGPFNWGWYAIRAADRWTSAYLEGDVYDPEWSVAELCAHLVRDARSLPLGKIDITMSRDGRLVNLPSFPSPTEKSLDKFHKEFGDMVKECISDLSLLSMNSIENLRDLFEAVLRPLEALPDIPLSARQLYKLVRHPKKMLHAAASLHLWHRYVFKTSLSDLKELRSALKNLHSYLSELSTLCLKGRARTHRTDVVRVSEFREIEVKTTLCEQLRVHYAPNEVRDLAFWSETTGMSLSLAKIWDLIPLSFAVDWVINGQDFLGNIDAYGYIFNHDIRGCTYSTHSQASFDVSIFHPNLSGVLYEDTYIRDVSNEIRFLPELYVQLADWPQLRKQWVTATSLVVSGVK